MDRHLAPVDAAGILLGLYNCRQGNSETLLEYSPDYAAERASGVVSDCARLGIELPAIELIDMKPEWSALLHLNPRSTRCPHR